MLLNEDVQVELAKALRRRGIDAITVEELKRRGLEDEKQLEFATNANRAVFTYNVKDFVNLNKKFVAQGKHHKGIIVSKQLSVGEILKRLINLVSTLSAEEMEDRLEFLSSWR